ncbi:ABC transporter permease [Tepidimonas charontis]|uniref:Macrolide export ATP-binding/permease protein MacB n=1 Tax=Tepidimonas charontis TaxID=2267262 RepID=A0A554X7S3_9BURK|nr:ABC transporter permease [Tepidimonas charontis]TSE31870.1 Macrolide export ATP-binding/permease protein MacB [Tepidimonas charontis]
MWLNTLWLALRSIRRNLLRSFLTVLGVVIGVAAVVTMVTVGNGATRAIQQQIASLGVNLLQVRPGQRLGPGGSGGAPWFKLSDAAVLASQVPGVWAVAAETRTGGTVVANGRNWSSSIVGGSDDWLLTNNWTLAEGRPFTEDELRVGAAVCLVGETVRRELYGTASPVGDTVRVRQVPCEVVGVLAPKGQGAFGQDLDDIVLMPINTLHRRVVGHTRVYTLHVSMQDGADADAVKAALRQILRERRSLAEEEEDNFNILDTQQLAETMAGTTRIMTLLLGAVAAVSLLVGGIGIMNIMLVSVTERTREIGLRLAIGARERDVMGQFLVEAVVLAALGGLVGLLLALGASVAISRLMQVPFAFDPTINAVAFAFSAAIGVLFGYVPARRAARLDPIEALRHE